jgi:hypothetical protein
VNEFACFEPAEVAAVAELPPDHPRRAHARECARCGALLESYEAFLTADAGAASPRELAEADAKLGAAIAALTGVDPAAAGAGIVARSGSAVGAEGAPGAPRVAQAGRPDRRSWWRWALTPQGRLAYAAAAIAVLGIALLLPRQRPESAIPQVPVLRGGAPGAAFTVARAALDPAGLSIAWAAWPGADAYQLVFYTSDLREVARRAAVADTALTVPRDALPASGADGVLLVRVLALHGGDVITESHVVSLHR